MTTSVKMFALVALVFGFSACSNADLKKTKSGAPYKIIGKGSGAKIQAGDIVKFHLTQKVKDSVLSTTYGQFPRYERIDSATGNSYDVRSIVMETLRNAKKGDSIYITLSMDSFIKRDPSILENTPFKKGDFLITGIKVIDVFKTPEEAQEDIEKESRSAFGKDPKINEQKQKDEKAIEEYLNAKGIKAERTSWGAYIEYITRGTGESPKPRQYALVRYTGTDFSGKVFDTNNKPGGQLYPVQIGAGGSIIGFEDAIRQMPKGSKARVYVPSVLAYGEMGSPPLIQPNQNLMFEIEVVDITDTPPQQQMPQAPADTTRR